MALPGPYTVEDIGHTWWLILVIILLIIAFGICSFLGFIAPLTSKWRRIVLPQTVSTALCVLVWIIFGTSGSVYSVLILTLPVLGPVVAAIAMWFVDWRRERRRDKMVKKGNFTVEVGDDLDPDGGFLSPCSGSGDYAMPRSRAVSSWTVEGLPDSFQATLDAIRNPRYYSMGRGYSEVADPQDIDKWAQEESSALIQPSVSRCERRAGVNHIAVLDTIAEGEVYQGNAEQLIPLGDGYSLEVSVGMAPNHKIDFTVHRQRASADSSTAVKS
ncbi:hypothetical protein FOL47_004753 [Perkinsus chesapeaki]|uniref:Uncharacterized protein n=1 Tax=Perkinsus chesapeaki TaxID=330153 RepID=A0A7J6MYW6_PERCH|nr:hypothetical protein FOL47_004753 [Perkinsus chesapeaki]